MVRIVNWEKISQEEAIYRLGLKRNLARMGTPRDVTRHWTTEDLEGFFYFED